MNGKHVSLIIAAHNEGDCLYRTIESCLESSSSLDLEIVVADDASSDGCVERVARDFPQVRHTRHSSRQGASPTKALGARAARGDIFVFLDGHTKPAAGSIERMVRHVETLAGDAIITPRMAALNVKHWRTEETRVGSGYKHDLQFFDTDWVPEIGMRAVDVRGHRYFESPSLIGCAFAMPRDLYEKLWGFDQHMRSWGVEDLDFGLKCWLMGNRILHAPDVEVAHRFRKTFDNYSVPYAHLLVNKLRMARKTFTQSVWISWLEHFREKCLAHSAPSMPEGMWAHAWHLFEQDKASLEQERAYLHARRAHDEFWYAQRFGLSWPRLETGSALTAAARPDEIFRLLATPSHAPPAQVPVLKLLAPAPGTTFAITADARMPQVMLRARIQGVQPDPTPTTAFTWTVHLGFQASSCPNGPARTINPPDVIKSQVGSQLNVSFPAIRGGTMTVTVTATFAGHALSAQVSGIVVVGTNPPLAVLRNALPHDTMRRIARLESGMRQFNGPADGGTSGCPLFSADKLGGVGVMQLTNPPPTDDEVWSWRRNVATGTQVFNQKVVAARQYPGKVRNSNAFKTLVQKFNQARQQQHLPPVQVTLPDFTTGNFNDNLLELELDAIRGFNGFGGQDAFGFPLHEFRVAMDAATGLLAVNIDPTGLHGTAGWEQVPTTARPATFGDPDYVAHVLAQQP